MSASDSNVPATTGVAVGVGTGVGVDVGTSVGVAVGGVVGIGLAFGMPVGVLVAVGEQALSRIAKITSIRPIVARNTGFHLEFFIRPIPVVLK